MLHFSGLHAYVARDGRECCEHWASTQGMKPEVLSLSLPPREISEFQGSTFDLPPSGQAGDSAVGVEVGESPQNKAQEIAPHTRARI